MGAVDEMIEATLTPEALAARFRAPCADPRLADLLGRIELDLRGRMLMSAANNRHCVLQFAVGHRLARLGGRAQTEAVVLTPTGVLVRDVVWCPAEFVAAHGAATPFPRAPEICVEIVSASNSRTSSNVRPLRSLVRVASAQLDRGRLRNHNGSVLEALRCRPP